MSFDLVFDRVIGHEGGYVFDIHDPGGETRWGISARSHPTLDIKNLTRDEAKAIYRADYWDEIGGDSLPAPIAFQVFDMAVNSGVTTAIRYLQRAVGVADDGVLGPVSRSAIEKADVGNVIMYLNAERLDFMTRLVHWPHFGKGWARRIATNLRYGAEDTDGYLETQNH